MSADEYSKYSCSIRRISILDQYKSIIAGWIMRFPCISSAQICDWLKENYPYDFKERTVSRFVKALREELCETLCIENALYSSWREPVYFVANYCMLLLADSVRFIIPLTAALNESETA